MERRQQEEATASVWSAPSEPRYVENRNVVLPAAAAKSSSESTAAARNGEQQQQLQAQVARASSDFSNLYSLSPQRAVSLGVEAGRVRLLRAGGVGDSVLGKGLRDAKEGREGG